MGSLSTQPHAYGRSLLRSPPNDGNCKLSDGLARKIASGVLTVFLVVFNCKLAAGNKEGRAVCERPTVCRGVWKPLIIHFCSSNERSAGPLHTWGLLYLEDLHFKPSRVARAKGHTLLWQDTLGHNTLYCTRVDVTAR